MTALDVWRARARSHFVLRADGTTFDEATMTPAGRSTWRRGDVTVTLVETVRADGSTDVVLEATGVRTVHEVALVDVDVAEGAAVRDHAWMGHRGLQRSTALFVRHPDGGAAFACVANPFGEAAIDGRHVRLSYRPGVTVGGTFRSDPFVVGPVRLTGRTRRMEIVEGRDTAEGVLAPQVSAVSVTFPVEVDAGEVAAVRVAVEARMPWDPARARVSHWDWGENPYRLALHDDETVRIYERMAALCAEVGVEVTVLSPAPRLGIGVYERGPWTHLMFLGQGVEVSEGSWAPGAEPVGLDEVLAAFRDRGVATAVYTNPLIDFLRRDAWRFLPVDHPEGAARPERICLAAPGAAEWFADTVRSFVEAYGLGGATLDFVAWHPCAADDHGHEPGEASRWAQWDAYRRILTSLRAHGVDWIETLLGSTAVVPWGIEGATHPHPVLTDNQPQWVPAWPDLSVDRANAHHQRRAAWWYRNLAFLPTSKVPGQVGHQANRRRLAPVERGWDWEGARYNLLASIGSAPSSTVLCFLPCWDEDEWAAVRSRDGAFFRWWLDFAKEHAAVLSRLVDLFDDARPGAVDGTMAEDDDGRGFVFLANPDYVPRVAQVPDLGDRLLRELHPVAGRLWSSAVEVDRNEVAVLEVVLREEMAWPALVGAAGSVDGAGDVVAASGRPGALVEASVWASPADRRSVRLAFADDGVVPTIAGWVDDDGAAIDLAAASGRVRAHATWAPGAVLPGLLASLEPGVAPVNDEVLQPWSDPSRLRLFPQLLDPRAVGVRLWVDGEAQRVDQAYIGTYEDVHGEGGRHNLLGHHVDLTGRLRACADLTVPWAITLELDGLVAGRWLGLHVAHLPLRTTDRWEVLR